MAQLPARQSARNVTMIDPSREFEDIYDRMGQLITMAFGDLPAGQVLNAPWRPLANISETDDGYQVEVELPGVNKDQLNVELNDRELAITGEVAEPKQEDGSGPHRSPGQDLWSSSGTPQVSAGGGHAREAIAILRPAVRPGADLREVAGVPSAQQ